MMEEDVREDNRRKRTRSNTDLMIAAKLGQEEEEAGESFRERLWSAWSQVALDGGHDTLDSNEIRAVFQQFG